MILILCLAGLNTRFHNSGFDIPKYLLPFGNEPIIAVILQELTKNYTFSDIIIVANQRDITFKPTLVEVTAKYMPLIHYVTDTAGQATTAFLAAQLVDKNSPILIHNGDTILQNRNIHEIEFALTQADAYIDVFFGTNPAYCYIVADHETNELLVTGISEKVATTDFASSGLYGFKSANFYIEQYVKTIINKNEIFISTILEPIITKGNVVRNYINIDHGTLVLGTPVEYFTAFGKLV